MDPAPVIDPAWVSIIIGVVGSVIGSAVTGAIAFAALKAWMARREEREHSIGVQVGRIQNMVDDHGHLLADHHARIRATFEHEAAEYRKLAAELDVGVLAVGNPPPKG